MLILGVVTAAFFLLLVKSLRHVPHSITSSSALDTTLVKPEEIKIIGLLFYGRKRSLEILDCYLQKNLVSNGGFLDEIRFIRGTDDIDDIVWVSQKVREVDGYTLIRSDANEYGDYHAMWMHTQAGDEGQIYVKIDDDLVGVRLEFIATIR